MSKPATRAGAASRKPGRGQYLLLAAIWTIVVAGAVRSFLNDSGRALSDPSFRTAMLLALVLGALGAGAGILLGYAAILLRKRRTEFPTPANAGRP